MTIEPRFNPEGADKDWQAKFDSKEPINLFYLVSHIMGAHLGEERDGGEMLPLYNDDAATDYYFSYHQRVSPDRNRKSEVIIVRVNIKDVSYETYRLEHITNSKGRDRFSFSIRIPSYNSILEAGDLRSISWKKVNLSPAVERSLAEDIWTAHKLKLLKNRDRDVMSTNELTIYSLPLNIQN